MSGDVQPRKRKDKKKKKDEPTLPPFVYVREEAPAPAARDGGGGSPSAAASPDELIHIYKESRLGGNICAKIVFFLLLGSIAVMVGLIITEHRGSNEVATASDSPWSQLLEGWIDDSPPDKHDDEHDVAADSGEHDEHDDDGGHDDDEHGDEHDEEHDDEHDEEHEDHDESDVLEQEFRARAARSVESESKSDDDFDEITDALENMESEKAEEEAESLEPITHIIQPPQESDPEVSDGEEISGSEDEPSPPPAAVRRTGGPKEVDEFLEWPMGPDYPPEQSNTPPLRAKTDYDAMEAQIEEEFNI